MIKYQKGEVTMHNWKWLRALLLGAAFAHLNRLVHKFSVASGVHSAIDPDVMQADETRVRCIKALMHIMINPASWLNHQNP